LSFVSMTTCYIMIYRKVKLQQSLYNDRLNNKPCPRDVAVFNANSRVSPRLHDNNIENNSGSIESKAAVIASVSDANENVAVKASNIEVLNLKDLSHSRQHIPFNEHDNLEGQERPTFCVSSNVVTQNSAFDENVKDENRVKRFVNAKPFKKASVFKFRKTTQMLFSISLIYVLSYIPAMFLNLLHVAMPYQLTNMNSYMRTLYFLSYNLKFLGSATNPVVYSFCNSKFRLRCMQIIHVKRKMDQLDQSSDTK